MGSVFNKIGGAVKLVTKSITANGTYNAASDNADGYSQVSVNVPLTTKSITANGTYNSSSDNAAGYSQVSVNVRSSRNLLWSGSSSSGVSVDLSAYTWVYIEVTGGSRLLLQVGGSEGVIGLMESSYYGDFGTAHRYRATTSGIESTSSNKSATEVDSRIIYITAVYGITDIN